MDGLCTLKFTEKYEGSIHNIGLDPPVVHYFIREQILLFENFPEEIKIDATGSVIKSIMLPNGETCSHIYLFQAVAIVNPSFPNELSFSNYCHHHAFGSGIHTNWNCWKPQISVTKRSGYRF